MILLFLVVPYFSVFAQLSDSEMEDLKVKWRVELRSKGSELSLKKSRVEGMSDFSDSIQRIFLEDTFVVENLFQRQLEKESTTLGINKANLACASEYALLGNKYYNLLLAKMKTQEDKELLVSWQDEWKTLMEKERALIGVFMQEPYSGGGSIHSIEYTNRLMVQQKSHLLLILDYLTHLI